ncbi:hypothetical protein ppKF707_2319 [Metapseudomonas furukawaii]|nr:hypothetical protein ppKF707_2319 [Pseudomonas furukawaii]
MRRVHPGGFPGGAGRADVPAVRDHHRGVGGDLRHRRPDPVAGPLRPDAQARPWPAGGALPLVQHLLRPHDRGLWRRGAVLPQARDAGPAAVRRHDRPDGGAVRPGARGAGAG